MYQVEGERHNVVVVVHLYEPSVQVRLLFGLLLLLQCEVHCASHGDLLR